ncbi:hypothetical protein HOP50_15g75100 [Chloropicon primus]|uniref:Transmembrane protein n=1 Tax=Chloropicon primus TaxID=1764295 RepID=A0A5B8MWV9_9CHLO|nr:hypothetical protein A3770_15p74850 [Chloropicon primus]UPR04176.1 hypothetical protein HOP50_15g75100 [Chloropicon primus]|eukprot:QDZ24967.1 hypothetical protein A3770_15p74850 [Chloropicon primus]
MFEESKQALLNGVNTMSNSMAQLKSPKISRHAPPFVHAVVNHSRKRKEGGTPKNVHWIVLTVLAIFALFVFMFPSNKYSFTKLHKNS